LKPKKKKKRKAYNPLLQLKDREAYDRKVRLKKLIETGEKIPKDLKDEEKALR
jgi:hypothetical protein